MVTKKKTKVVKKKTVKKTVPLKSLGRKSTGKAKKKITTKQPQKNTKRSGTKPDQDNTVMFDSTLGKTDALFVNVPQETTNTVQAPAMPEPMPPHTGQPILPAQPMLPDLDEVLKEIEEDTQVEKKEELPQTPEDKPQKEQKKPWYKRIFNFNNRFFSIFIGLVFAGIFSTAVYVLAVGPFTPAETLNPGCTPGAVDCTINFGDLTGTSNQVSLSASGAGALLNGVDIVLSIPSNSQLSVAKLTNLTSNGFVKTTSSDGTLSIDTNTYLTNPLTTLGDILYAATSGAEARIGIGSSGQVLTVVGGIPAWATSTGGVTSITGSLNQVIASASTGAITLSLPQDIATTSTPQFARLGLGQVSSATIPLGVTSTTEQMRLSYNGSVYAPFAVDSGGNLSIRFTGTSFAVGVSAGSSGSTNQTNYLGYQAGLSASGADGSNFLGYRAGYGATGASNSSFLGSDSGEGATSASASNFFGYRSGYGATGAHDSNFIGFQAGDTATGAYHASFLGYFSGYQATNAYQSSFIGRNAGYGATSANDSNFSGSSAGYGATGASNSNFFGNSAGSTATGASQSNFFGQSAGYQATNATNSNFLGYLAGNAATGASYSNFLGQSAGSGATSASGSNFLGYQAGLSASGATKSNFIGYQAGSGATSASNSNFFGWTTGYGATGAANSNFIGISAGYNATAAANSNFIGYFAGYGATNSSYATFIGNSAGSAATDSGSSVFIGATSGYHASAAPYANFIGNNSGYEATNATASQFVGSGAGYQATNASYSSFIGDQAGLGATTATYSQFLGADAGSGATGANHSNFLGQQAGLNATGAAASNFLGNGAGRNATNAAYSQFIGSDAGNGATNARDSIFIGSLSGYSDTVNNTTSGTSIAIGRYSGTGGYKDSIALGHGVKNSAANQLNIGNVFYATGLYASDTPSATPITTGTYTLPGFTSAGFVKTSSSGLLSVDTTTYLTSASAVTSLTGTQNRITTSASTGAITLNLPQDIATTSTPQFARIGLGVAASSSVPLYALSTTEQARFAYNASTYASITTSSAGNLLIGLSATTGNIYAGYSAGSGVTGTLSAVFLGSETGTNATGATNSHFMGERTGMDATNASYSNFFGYQTGRNASSASNSNFLGHTAGFNATNASYSNFLGYQAGFGATNASYSNFLGNQAGSGATGATYANLLGYYAGKSSTTATQSNFIGYYAGYNATAAAYSNFIGSVAGSALDGTGATNAYYSNFIGFAAGGGPLEGTAATNAYYSNFFGYQAGYQAVNSFYANFFGYQAGFQATSAGDSMFVGRQAGYQATYADYSNFLGYQAGYQATNSANAVFIGTGAGNGADFNSNSNFIGYNAGNASSNGANLGASSSNFMGYNAGYQATLANNSVFIGSYAGNSAGGANNSIFIGENTGSYDSVDNSGGGTSIAIGQYAGTGGYSDSIAIGHGVINTAANQLNIGNVIYATGLYASDSQDGTPVGTATVKIAGLYGTSGTGDAVGVDSNGNLYDKDASSLRFKTNIEPLDVDFTKILQLQPKSFTYKKNGINSIGYIAEDVNDLGLTALVNYDQEGLPNSISYDRIPLYILEIVKQQQVDLDLLKVAAGLDSEGSYGTANTFNTSSLTSYLTSAVSQLLTNAGLTFKDGIANITKLTSDNLTVKTARISKMEMVDSATGNIYCTWIQNGDWQKAEGECNSESIAMTETSLESTQNKIEESAKQIEATADSAQKTAATAQKAAESATKASSDAEQASKKVKEAADKIDASTPSQTFDIISLAYLSNINVEYGTPISSLELPSDIVATTSGASNQTLNLTWNGGTPAYDGQTPGNYIFEGTLSLPDTITNSQSLKPQVNVIVGDEPAPAAEEAPVETGIQEETTPTNSGVEAIQVLFDISTQQVSKGVNVISEIISALRQFINNTIYKFLSSKIVENAGANFVQSTDSFIDALTGPFKTGIFKNFLKF